MTKNGNSAWADYSVNRAFRSSPKQAKIRGTGSRDGPVQNARTFCGSQVMYW
jgi:hypothetical protein